jgi:arylsulfatase A-like enzyme
MVGMITDALKEQGIFDETLVVFTSEHGDLAGDHGMTEKMSMYEESARVPLIIRAPAVSTDKTVIGGNVSQVDLVPTLLDLLGCDVPEGLDGKSVANVLEEGGNLRNNEVYVQWNGIGWVGTGSPEEASQGLIVQQHVGTPEMDAMYQAPWRTIVVNDWKLNLCATDRCELYNLREDPYEMNNLYDHQDHQDVVRLLSTKIRAWQFRTRDDAPI